MSRRRVRRIIKKLKSGKRFYRTAKRMKKLNRARPQRGGFHL